MAGRVQGVGYRYFAVSRAELHGIVGFVRNMDDGTVEVMATGPKDALADFIADLDRGPSSGRVESCRVHAVSPVEEFRDFSIGY